MLNLFQSIANLAVTATGRVTEDHEKFLVFYRGLVETVPPEVAELFGSLTVAVVEKGELKSSWGVLLTATDYLFWKQKIAEGVRFSPSHGGAKSVPRALATRLAKKAEEAGLTLQERQALLALLDGIE
jgi:hypothetical protein